MKGLKGRIALVTGGGSGIGQAIAVRLAEEGCDVAINYLKSREGAEETERLVGECCSQVKDCGAKNLLVQADVSKEDEVIRMVDTVAKEFGGLEILINNAGIQIPGASHEAAIADFDRVISVNVRGAYLCAKEAIKHFLANDVGGTIVNVSSVHEIIPKPKYIGYSVSKGGMGNLTRTLALEYAANGIRVNAVGPGATITPINRAWVDDPQTRAEVESHIPLGRAASAQEVAGVVAFLASEEAAYITGQTLYVDGGLTLYGDFRTPWSSGE